MKRSKNIVSPTKKRLDPEQVFLEWVVSNKNFKQFAAEKKISNVTLWRWAKKNNWEQRRNDIISEGRESALEVTSDVVKEKFIRHIKANEDLLDLVEKKIAHEGEDLDVDEIGKLASALDKITKNKSFMTGGPTERIDNRSVSLHADIVHIVEERRRERNPGTED